MPVSLHQQATLVSITLHRTSTKNISFIMNEPKSSFKALIQASPSLLSVSLKMSQDKTVPTTLCHNETERGFYGTNAPIRYVPEKDLVYETLSDSTSTTNSIKMTGGNKTTIKVWDGCGNNESFIDFAMQSEHSSSGAIIGMF